MTRRTTSGQRLPNAAHGRRRHYWQVFSRDHGDPASWAHEIGFDTLADARDEADDIRDHGRVARVIPCLYTDEPALMVAALNAQGKRRASRPLDMAEPMGVVVSLCEAASRRGRT